MWLLAKVARRPLNRRTGGHVLAVLSRQQLSRSASVAVVQVADRALVVGITEQQVSFLAEADLETVNQHAHEPVERRDPVPVPEDLDEAEELYQAEYGAVPTSPAPAGPLHGSLLSPHTWAQTVDFLRDRTARR